MAALFELEAFFARVHARHREKSWLRQNLVRGLKDWFLTIHGYDRYGAETAFLVRERMGEPRIFGYAALRILRDRRISDETKVLVARETLEILDYDSDLGPPFGLLETVDFLLQRDRLTTSELRYAMLAAIAHENPFAGVEAPSARGLVTRLMARQDMPVEERAFWGHSLVTRHVEGFRVAALVDALIGSNELPQALRAEMCWSWVHLRQSRLTVPIPASDGSYYGRFVEEHMPFWVAHMPSWPRSPLVRRGLLWLSRLGEDPLALAQVFIAASDTPDEQVLAAVADIIAEHHQEIPRDALRSLIDRGSAPPSPISARRRFYRLGIGLLGREYLERAANDSAASVRHWAARQVEQESSAAEERLPLSPRSSD